MILEIADIRIAPGQNAAFEAAIQLGLSTLARRAPGFKRAIVGPFFAAPPVVEHFHLVGEVGVA